MISVVVPIYNGEKFIEETYNNIARSTETDIEILFVNDGSSDTSEEIIETIKKNDARVRCFKKENGGIASARNFGMQHARGEYICFFDQDDVVKPDMLRVLLSDLKTTGADFAKGAFNYIVNGKETPLCETQNAHCIERGSNEYDYYLQTLTMRYSSPHPECQISVNIWSCIFRMDFLINNRILFKAFCDYEDDWIFMLQAYSAAKKVCLEDKTVYSWRIHNMSESHNRIKKDRYLPDLYANFSKMREYLFDIVAQTNVCEKDFYRFKCELQKECLLWCLSNETGKGIQGRSIRDSVKIVKAAVDQERKMGGGVLKDTNKKPLAISVYGATGIKKCFYTFRDKILFFMITHRLEALGVILNKKILHGRWHI